jgi:hypothetical protein
MKSFWCYYVKQDINAVSQLQSSETVHLPEYAEIHKVAKSVTGKQSETFKTSDKKRTGQVKVN